MARKAMVKVVVAMALFAVSTGQFFAVQTQTAPAGGAAAAKGMLEVTYYYLPG